MIAATSRLLSRIGGALLLASALLITGEIIARKLLGSSWNVATELSGYALAIGSSFAFADALLARAHIRVDVLYRTLPRPVRAVLDLASIASLSLLGLMLAWRIFDVVAESVRLGARENTSLGTLLAIPQGLWWIGIVWFAFVAVWLMVRTAVALLRRDLDTAQHVAGPAGIEEELAEALADANTRLARTKAP
jgi:TRAP-type C4-dicarboxylate transport system permease small subunit